MSDFPKSASCATSLAYWKHAAALSVAEAKSAELKSKLERDAKHARTEHEVNRLAELAKTARLRAARLALAADARCEELSSGTKSTPTQNEEQ
jgi:hypothetical protein